MKTQIFEVILSVLSVLTFKILHAVESKRKCKPKFSFLALKRFDLFSKMPSEYFEKTMRT
jgi:hypothetical protein